MTASISEELPVPRVGIIGAGALGQQVAQHLRQSGEHQVVGFFDDTLPEQFQAAHGPVLGPIASIAECFAAGRLDQLLMGIGYHHLAFRQRLFEELVLRFPFATFLHPTANIDPSARIGPGSFIMSGCIIDINVVVGPNCFMYPGCIIAHDSQLAGHTLLAPAVKIAGNVRVAPRCFLGIGSTIADGLAIGTDIRIGAGTVVIGDLAMPGTYVGSPAHLLPTK